MKKSILLILFLTGIIAVTGVSAWISLGSSQNERFQANIVESLSKTDDTARFKKVTKIPDLKISEDFGPHPEYQTEWWYYTGNLASADGRRFGYQLTFFRRAITAQPLEGESKWRTSQIYFAHFALSDIRERKFYSYERFSREALGLSGSESPPFRVWIEDWQARQDADGMILTAKQDNVAIELILTPVKPVALQGDRGLSQKGNEQGNASVYFSLTRLATRGLLTVNNLLYQVNGYSWMDKEWSTSALEKNAVGWDWFSIQLDDNRELTLFQIRSEDARKGYSSYGSVIDKNGQITVLDNGQFTVSSTKTWKSAKTGVTYPSAWLVEVPSRNLALRITPLMAAQEHRHSFRYWEGAVEVESKDISGYGYVELTGYQ